MDLSVDVDVVLRGTIFPRVPSSNTFLDRNAESVAKLRDTLNKSEVECHAVGVVTSELVSGKQALVDATLVLLASICVRCRLNGDAGAFPSVKVCKFVISEGCCPKVRLVSAIKA